MPGILWNPEVQFRIHESPQPVPILSQISPVHALSYFLEDSFSHYPPIYALLNGLFLSGLLTNNLYAHLLSPTCYMSNPSHTLNVIARIMFDEEYRS